MYAKRPTVISKTVIQYIVSAKVSPFDPTNKKVEIAQYTDSTYLSFTGASNLLITLSQVSFISK